MVGWKSLRAAARRLVLNASEYELAYEPGLLPPPALMREADFPVLEEWFRWAEEWSVLLRGSDLRNTYYNPNGVHLASEYRFPSADASIDVAFGASVFTHMVPENTQHYLREAARVLRPGGKCLFSFFVLDHYRPGQLRPYMFGQPDFNFDHSYDDHGNRFAVARPDNPELMTAYNKDLIQDLARSAGLRFSESVLPGLWSGSFEKWVGVQDLVVLEKLGSTGDNTARVLGTGAL